MDRLKLHNVTLLSIDDVDTNASIELFLSLFSRIEFGDAMLFSSKASISQTRNLPFLRKSDPINNIFDYNKFLIKESYKSVNTTHVLVVQRDGYPVNTHGWKDQFLLYDYIGAPWPDGLVGNGGFSLRSKRLFNEVDNFEDLRFDIPEDTLICHPHYLGEKLRSSGIKFAPHDLAMKFSAENRIWTGEFGFHGELTYDSLKNRMAVDESLNFG